MFRLTTAPFRVLEDRFIADVMALCQSDSFSSVLVVIPTGRLRTHLQRQLVLKQPGLLDIHFLTFFGLAEQIVMDGPLHEDRIVGESALYREIIRELLEGTTQTPFQLREDFLGAGKTITRGLPGALAGTLKDLRDAGVRVTDALKAALEGHLGPEAASAAPTLELYAHVYGILQKLNLRTPSDLLRRAAEHAPKSSFLKKQKAIFVYGFYDMTGVQLDLTLSLANHPDAKMYFPYEKNNPAYVFAEKLLNDSGLVAKVERNLVLSTLHPHPSTTYTNCSGARDEVWFAAKEIQRLMDDGLHPSEIAVISRTLTPYFSALRDIFSSHQIPYVTSKNEPAGSHPWIKTLRAQLREHIEDIRATWLDHASWAKQFIHDVTPAGCKPGATSDNPQGSGLTDCRDDSIFLRDTVLDSLEQLKILDVLGKPVSRQRFIETWEDKLDALEMPGPETPLAGVQVLEAQQARGLRFKAVFLLGLNEKTFPRLIREDPFLSDAARSTLAQALGARLGRKLDGYQEERFLFELMRQTAESYLYLVWQRSDEEGKAVIPSIYIQELLRVHKAKPARLPRSLPDKLKERAAVSLTPKELSYVINRAGAIPDPLYAALGWDSARFNRLLQAHRAVESFRPGILALDGLIRNSDRLSRLVAKGFSPSGLEDLATCPYKFYAGHILRLPAPEDPAPGGQLASNTLGTLFHKVLELYFINRFGTSTPHHRAQALTGDPSENTGSPTTTSRMTALALSKACDQAFVQFEQTYPGLYPVVIKSSKQIIYQYLSSFIESDLEELLQSHYTPAYAEQLLESPVRELGPELSHIRFRGRVDRIDLKNEEGVWVGRVVDYKSGKAREVSGKIETALIQGSYLQLPIYMGLVREFLMKEKGVSTHVESSMMRWLRLEDQGKTEPYLAESFWKSPHAKTFIENMKGLVKLAEEGHFYIVPSTGEWGHCSRCGFARVCRKEHMPTRARSEGDPVRIANDKRLSRTAIEKSSTKVSK